MTEFTKDEHGSIIDPPVLPEYEARLNSAHLAGDDDAIQRIQAEYHDAREKEVNARADRARESEQRERDERRQQDEDDRARQERQDAANRDDNGQS